MENTIKVYFQCPECGSDVVDGEADLRYDLDGVVTKLSSVPVRVCKANRHELVDGPVAENVNRLVDRVLEDVQSFSNKLPAGARPVREVAIVA